MDQYDSDSSGIDDFTETNVLLGYADDDASDDSISHLGGWPTWLDPATPPPGDFARCKVCNNPMLLLLQLNGDLPEHFPHDERWLYIFGCPRKSCTRKNGSLRALRGVKKHKIVNSSSRQQQNNQPEKTGKAPEPTPAESKPKQDLGSSLFGAAPSSQGQSANPNPFSTASSPSQANPFASLAPTSSLAAKPPQKPSSPPPTESLPETFAEKVRLSSPPPRNPAKAGAAGPPLPWPPQSAFPKPYPHHHLDAEYETLSRPPSPTLPTTAQPVLMDEDSSMTAGAEPKDTFESAMDKSFLRFSARLGHNPEQVLRYEFRGAPLLYSTTDAVGKLFSSPFPSAKSSHVKVSTRGSSAGSPNRIPRCEYCGRERVFEVQLTPHAITVLEEGREGIGLGPEDDTGMEWGTVILGVCAANCGLEHEGVLGWREEWVGVQWEERVAGK
ncbi:PDCD2_C domain-containing protein, variant 2 [Blastomyces gilchristii SLH14081]|uniref:PDCD2_C domain-containing protein n=1 Tax=Blastomyces gilchristii (strain SLH14081) TaxID=559298 RepID=A0A179UB78_BLAGS|nr:PDCD2_C domain-containing protein [Blastomyces gilchristii SLH14081]XP_031575808.1 PDCD2_C domain-containing protein, variant 1 [Blastomyces gilchristii SLH14081]XP_031575809.1 PDCD2_C domain-containing protein, variant 2 [Blastomyces gilchristii SLH14081]OAT03781.1 PDCD2_C domain-containing protein [Blastomyces gilchristii SLH14081]OAT03782.1 PDCD2_C domain-containing protein, variant 1 [Blastomyces gilchristii SLH14081]OAT03783.1 PDCD2_C domain-containing protein, variant 2 [Blastomyces g